MTHPYRPFPMLELPGEFDDHTVAQLLELLYELATALENHYADQLHRYYFPCEQHQYGLWPEDEPCEGAPIEERSDD